MPELTMYREVLQNNYANMERSELRIAERVFYDNEWVGYLLRDILQYPRAMVLCLQRIVEDDPHYAEDSPYWDAPVIRELLDIACASACNKTGGHC